MALAPALQLVELIADPLARLRGASITPVQRGLEAAEGRLLIIGISQLGQLLSESWLAVAGSSAAPSSSCSSRSSQ